METEAFERRRYSAVLLWHPKLSTFRDLVEASMGGIAESVAVSVGQPGWTARRAEWISVRSHYPEHLVDPKSRKRRDGFAHDFYIAVRKRGTIKGVPCFLVASPYVRLLGALVLKVSKGIDHPAPMFGSVNIDDAVRYFEQTSVDSLRTRRVTLQMLNEVALELVSLSGRNPLHSNLLEAIRAGGVAAPYSLGVDVNERDYTRVNFDRHGNFWWYLSEESLLVNPLNLIDRMIEAGLVGTSRSVPLSRAAQEE